MATDVPPPDPADAARPPPAVPAWPDDAIARADRIEAAAFADLFAAAPPALAARLGLRVETVGGATALVAPGIPSAMFNRVIGLGLGAPADAAAIRALAALYDRAGSAVWWLHWSPAAEPAGFDRQLPGFGFTQPARSRWAKLMRSTAAPGQPPRAPGALQVGPAGPDEAATVGQAVARAFEMPPFMGEWLAALQGRPGWTVYAARDGGAIVGGACLFVEREDGWLGMGAVLPAQRRRGGQQALIARRLADAAAAGCRWATSETGEPAAGEPNPSLDNLRRCGFETVASRLNHERRRADR